MNKKDLAVEYGVNLRTVQRDLDEIRNHLADRLEGENLVYDHRKRGYCLQNLEQRNLSAVELFALEKILLESRALCTEEMSELINLLNALIPKSERGMVKPLVHNELTHYQQPLHGKPLLKLLWDMSQAIMRRQTIRMEYVTMKQAKRSRVVYPLSIVFSEFYFYLIAQIEEYGDQDPAFFRIDRIESFTLVGKTYPYQSYEEGIVKKRTPYMFGGKLHHLKFLYRGPSVEAILDRFPTARITQSMDSYVHIEAEVYGSGCLLWLMGQGNYVEVLEPQILRDELREKIEMLHQLYSKE